VGNVTVRYWAGARRAAGRDEEQLDVATVAELRAALAARAGLDRLSEVVSFLVDGAPSGDPTGLYDGAVVDVLPPFAGG
jgi:molybdopterin converting factor small subunit